MHMIHYSFTVIKETFTLDGHLSSDAEHQTTKTSTRGGASGGSVIVECSTFKGVGLVSVNGGHSLNRAGGAGLFSSLL